VVLFSAELPNKFVKWSFDLPAVIGKLQSAAFKCRVENALCWPGSRALLVRNWATQPPWRLRGACGARRESLRYLNVCIWSMHDALNALLSLSGTVPVAGVPGQRPAACADRAADAVPPAAVATSHPQD